MNNNNTKVKSRMRLRPAKKWTEREEKLLIEFLLQNKVDFETPTAQIYYRRFCNEKKLNIEWQLVRSKVRNMRMSYTRTKSTLEAIGGDDKESVNQTILRCKYYNELDMIFSQLYVELANNSWEQSKISFVKNSLQADTDDSTTEIDVLPTSTSTTAAAAAAANRKGDFNGTSVPNLIKTEGSICLSEPSLMSLMEDEIDIDVNTQNKALSIEERKLALEEKKLQLEEKKLNSREKIKIYKINSREKLKLIEMEMHERLAVEELKLKYK